jgi:hypothetical protein
MTHVRDWRIEIMRAHPRLFEVMTDEPHLSFGYPLCEEGWRDILERLCVRIENALQDGEAFEFVRMKQKMGLPRADWEGEVSDETRTRILQATNLGTARSACTCEVCGAEGRLHSSHGWLATLCSEHARGEPVPVERGRENNRLYRRRPWQADMFYARYDRETDSLTEIPRQTRDPEEE